MNFKKWEIYTGKEGLEISPLNIAKQAIIRIDNENNAESKLENIFAKIPMFNKIVEMVDDVEVAAPYVIFVLVHPKDYKVAVKNAGNISVTVADRLGLEKKPLIAVRNDLFTKPGNFELNIMLADEVTENAPYNVLVRVSTHDEVFIKRNSRNIASTIAGRLGSWKFPFVSVKPDMLLENLTNLKLNLKKEEVWMTSALTKSLIKLTTKLNPIAVGTKFFPTNSLETEYVELFNYTQTILFELEKAQINSDTILQNLIRDVGAENIPVEYTFHELKPAENRIEEYALVSNIIMGSDRYFYIEIPHPSNLINIFVKIIENEAGEIVEKQTQNLLQKC